MTADTQLESGRVYIYGLELACASACAPAAMPADEVAAMVNSQSPTGISSPWQVAEDPFANGTPNPAPCDQDAGGRRHWLLEC